MEVPDVRSITPRRHSHHSDPHLLAGQVLAGTPSEAMRLHRTTQGLARGEEKNTARGDRGRCAGVGKGRRHVRDIKDDHH